ncbi:MAG: hypothetical protein IT175_06025 [Acidobacteria bacterium]|nr:hypothetical protein [Acidobacteriota bacterium]
MSAAYCAGRVRMSLRKVSRIPLRKWLNHAAKGAYGIRTRVLIPDLGTLLRGPSFRAWSVPVIAVGGALILVPAGRGATLSAPLSRVAGLPVNCYAAAEWEWPGVLGWASPAEAPDRQIALSPGVCASITASLHGRYGRWFPRVQTGDALLARQSEAWQVFAHEVAHTQGYDHGEHTIGADCRAERIDRTLMRAAGLPRAFVLHADTVLTIVGCDA